MVQDDGDTKFILRCIKLKSEATLDRTWTLFSLNTSLPFFSPSSNRTPQPHSSVAMPEQPASAGGRASRAPPQVVVKAALDHVARRGRPDGEGLKNRSPMLQYAPPVPQNDDGLESVKKILKGTKGPCARVSCETWRCLHSGHLIDNEAAASPPHMDSSSSTGSYLRAKCLTGREGCTVKEIWDECEVGCDSALKAFLWRALRRQRKYVFCRKTAVARQGSQRGAIKGEKNCKAENWEV